MQCFVYMQRVFLQEQQLERVPGEGALGVSTELLLGFGRWRRKCSFLSSMPGALREMDGAVWPPSYNLPVCSFDRQPWSPEEQKGYPRQQIPHLAFFPFCHPHRQ